MDSKTYIRACALFMFDQGKSTKETVPKKLPHAPYSPDLAPSDYHKFRLMEHSLRNMQFTNIQHVRKWVGDFFASKPATFYDTGIRNLRERCKSTIATQGEYYID